MTVPAPFLDSIEKDRPKPDPLAVPFRENTYSIVIYSFCSGLVNFHFRRCHFPFVPLGQGLDMDGRGLPIHPEKDIGIRKIKKLLLGKRFR
jgi:hypothetical protein